MGSCPQNEMLIATEVLETIFSGSSLPIKSKCIDARKEVFVRSWYDPDMEHSGPVIVVPKDAIIKITSIDKKDSKYNRYVEFTVKFNSQTYTDSFLIAVVPDKEYIMQSSCAEVLSSPTKFRFVREECIDKK